MSGKTQKSDIDRTPLIPYRKRLDAVDEEILSLFADRYNLRREMIPLKIALDQPIRDKIQMETVIDRAVRRAEEQNIPEDFAADLYELILKYSHKFEQSLRSSKDINVPSGEAADPKEITLYRRELEHIDAAIIETFGRRYRIRDETMPVKIKHNMPIEVQSRVDEVIEQMQEKARTKNIPVDFARELYQLVIDYSHLYERQYRQKRINQYEQKSRI